MITRDKMGQEAVNYNVLFVGMDEDFQEELQLMGKELNWPVTMLFADTVEYARGYSEGRDVRLVVVAMERVNEVLALNLKDYFHLRPIVKICKEETFLPFWDMSCKGDANSISGKIKFLIGDYQ